MLNNFFTNQPRLASPLQIWLLQSSKVHVVSKWFASSKTCSKCGHRIDKLKLSQRIYICPNCGFKEDRDINAAINILKESTSGTEGFKKPV